MDSFGSFPFFEKRKKIRIERPSVKQHETDELLEEARKFARLVPYAPDPNFGRVQEIKDEIRKGTYLQNFMTDEAAERLALRFMRQEREIPHSDESDESSSESTEES